MDLLFIITDTREDILFNLDTVVSIERGSRNLSVITTRWGRTNVLESLDHIKTESLKSNGVDIAPDVG